MGTSTRWKKPVGKHWATAAEHLSRWRPTQRRTDERLIEIAAEHLEALRRTVRTDPSAFGLYDATVTAGVRLCESLSTLHTQAPTSTHTLVADLVKHVGDDGGTLTDAAIRRAIGTAVLETQRRHPEWDDTLARPGTGGGLAWDVLCTLYRLFFAGAVTEFLRAVVVEQVSRVLPVLVDLHAEERITDWLVETLLDLIPNPCEEATRPHFSKGSEDLAETEDDAEQGQPLPDIAASLVPLAVRRVLGLATGEEEEKGEDRREGSTV